MPEAVLMSTLHAFTTAGDKKSIERTCSHWSSDALYDKKKSAWSDAPATDMDSRHH